MIAFTAGSLPKPNTAGSWHKLTNSIEENDTAGSSPKPAVFG
jgi:hypothetical protein